MWNDEREKPRRPVAEPEILPPERAGPRRPQEQVWVRQRVYVARPGPIGAVLALIGLAAFVATGIVLFLGLFIFLLPALGALMAVFILAALLRRPRRL